MSSTTDRPSDLPNLYPHIHDIEPLLDYQEFSLAETPVGGSDGDIHEIKGVLARLLQSDLLHKAEREQVDGKTRWRYEWAEGAREGFREYVADMDTLPCGCRSHIPPGRAYPDGWFRCKHCGTAHRRGVIEECV